MKKSLKNISDLPPELIIQIMSLMKSKDIKEYCEMNPYIAKICKENDELIVKYGLMNDLGIKKAPSKNVLKYLLKYPYNILQVNPMYQMVYQNPIIFQYHLHH